MLNILILPLKKMYQLDMDKSIQITRLMVQEEKSVYVLKNMKLKKNTNPNNKN